MTGAPAPRIVIDVKTGKAEYVDHNGVRVSLRRVETFVSGVIKVFVDDLDNIIDQLLIDGLQKRGVVVIVEEPNGDTQLWQERHPEKR